jgi:hypothetical protein
VNALVIGGRIVDSQPLLVMVAFFALLAGAAVVYQAIIGPSAHRTPRLMLGVSVLAVAGAYWWDILCSNPYGPVELRRGAALVLWASLLWITTAEIRLIRAQQKLAKKIEEGQAE